MKIFEIAGYKFALGENTERQERGRKTLINQRNRLLYGNSTPFASPLDRKGALESLIPFYSDIVGACRGINGDPEHSLLLDFLSDPLKWDDFYWEHIDTDYQAFFDAVRYTQELHQDIWYPKPQVTDEDAPEAAAVLKQALAAIDPDNPSDEPPPDTAEIMQAVQERNDAAAEKRDEDFLES
jgi:hypothetical protein